MSGHGLAQIVVYLIVLTALGIPLGQYMAWGTVVMILGRFLPIVIVLALAGSLASKKISPASRGTLRTDTPTFGVLLSGVIVVMSGLAILPALALGPIVEGLLN